MTQIARFRHQGQNKIGAIDGGDYIDLTRAYAAAQAAAGQNNADALADAVLPPDALSFFDGGQASILAAGMAVRYALGLDATEAKNAGIRVERSGTETLVPLPNPRKIVCVARNFGKHAAEAGLELSEIPILFPRFAATLVADGASIIVPLVSHQVDWEGELAVVIGKRGRHISQENAFDYIAGYTIFNDVTVRDYQFRVTQYTAGKNFSGSGPLGPHITLVDEVINPHHLQITTTVNGVLKQDGNTNEFVFDIPTIVEHVSEFIELEPGDIIAMGTPAGVGFKRTPPEFLADGDVVEVSIENIGTLRNTVRSEVSRNPLANAQH